MKIKDELMGLTPAEIVGELDRYIVGQVEAKKAVAIALRNRYRRQRLDPKMASEIVPKNILMIGPTGVGKTEIARRLAKLAKAPFIKVEATKFTEVGYVGRDVESIIRDLVEIAVNNHKINARATIENIAKEMAINKILDVVVGVNANQDTRDKFAEKITSGNMDEVEIEIELLDNSSASTSFEIPGMPGAAMGVLNLGDFLGKAMGGAKSKLKKLTIKEAMQSLMTEEADKIIDNEKIISTALHAVENNGIVFLDEIDKISSRSETKSGEVSREGVQRDLLPLIEGTNVTTKYGTVATDHILFIASGAFHLSKPSDLLPELQGRLPIRVELLPLVKNDLIRILVEPEFSIIKQYIALIATEGLKLEFTTEAIDKLAQYSIDFNSEIEDIGARRLHTVMEKLLEEISYSANDMEAKHVVIDEVFVDNKLSHLVKHNDLSKFIL